MGGLAFGRFQFDPDGGTLTRDGAPVRLQPQPARVLALLLARAGDVVRRDELREKIWGSDTFVDFERGLNFCIAQIRSALGDSAESPRFIETLPKRGYRFVAPVRTIDPGSAAHQLTGPPIPPIAGSPVPGIPGAPVRFAGISPRTAGSLILAGAVLMIVVAYVALGRNPDSVPPPPAAGRIGVAVVPFDNETGARDYDLIASGVADATVARLATPERVDRIRVVGNASALRVPREKRDLQDIGRRLGVDYVVLGQVKRDSDRVRLIAHLIRISDQAHLWARTFDGMAFTLDVQSELAEAIASAVVERLVAPVGS